MTGYYKLYWAESPFYLIGQTNNVAKRIGNHLSALRAGTHTNGKLQELYDAYGTPKDVRFACPKRDLDTQYNAYLAKHDIAYNIGEMPGKCTITFDLPKAVHDHYVQASNLSAFNSPSTFIRAMVVNHVNQQTTKQ